MQKRFFSLKWKLTLALIGSGCLLLVGYVIMAKSVFENDKIAYVYESQGVRLQTLSQTLRSQFEKDLLIVRAAVQTFESGQGRFSDFGLKIMKDDPRLVSLEVLNEKSGISIVHYERSAGGIPLPTEQELQSPLNELKVAGLEGGRFLAWQRTQESTQSPVLRIRFVTDLSSDLPQADANQFFALVTPHEVLYSSFPELNIRGVLDQLRFSNDVNLQTLPWSDQAGEFLVSSVLLGLGDVRLLAFTPKDLALGALSTLLIRSLLFLVIAFCVLVLISLFLAKKLTASLGYLAHAAERIGQGNFRMISEVSSNDEMGVLSNAMNEMTGEIERLLEETHDKARMESELQTARLVQEQLLPAQSSKTQGEMQVSGISISSSECGGDWWHYFAHGDKLYVAIADATGHGTPAALMTSAARSVFTRLEEERLSLPEMMRAWNKSVCECSRGRICMTALLVEIDCRTGHGKIVNASHEAPWIIRAREDHFEGEVIDLRASPPLGEGLAFETEETDFEIGPNESFIIFTDGLFSVERKDGKTLSEKRFLKALSTRAEFKKTAVEVVEVAQRLFEEHREGEALPDDVTLVVVRRTGPTLQPLLETEGRIQYVQGH